MAIGFNPQTLAGRTDFRANRQDRTRSGNPGLVNNTSFFPPNSNPSAARAGLDSYGRPIQSSGRGGGMPAGGGFGGTPPWMSYMGGQNQPGMGGMQPTKPGMGGSTIQPVKPGLTGMEPTKPGMGGGNGAYEDYVNNFSPEFGGMMRSTPMSREEWERQQQDQTRYYAGGSRDYDETGGGMPTGSNGFIDRMRNMYGGNWYNGPQNNQMLSPWWGNQVAGVGRYQPPMLGNMASNEWIGGNNPYRYNLPNNFGG